MLSRAPPGGDIMQSQELSSGLVPQRPLLSFPFSFPLSFFKADVFVCSFSFFLSFFLAGIQSSLLLGLFSSCGE